MPHTSDLDRKIEELVEATGSGSINFFGRQYGGKDKQSGRLAANAKRILGIEIPVLGGGEILRKSPGLLSEGAQDMQERGENVPSSDYTRIVLPFLSQVAFKDGPLFLSTVGRKDGEQHDVLEATAAAGHPTVAVPLLKITEEETWKRFQTAPSRGRADDTPEGVRSRLELFLTETQPVLDTYESLGLLVVVDAMPPEEEVFQTLVHSLHDRLTGVG